MRHGTVRIRLLITGKSILRKRAFPTHSVVSHRCPGNLFRGPRAPLAAPHARPAAARAPHYNRLRALSQLPPARLTAARTPQGRPCAPRLPPPPLCSAAAAPRRGRRPHAPLPPARPAVGRNPPRPPVRPMALRPLAARTPRGRSPCFELPHASRARVPPARRRRTRFDCLPCHSVNKQ